MAMELTSTLRGTARLVGGALVAEAGRRMLGFWMRAWQAARGARASRPYQRPRSGPVLMIFGDSVAAGVGAGDPAQSIAGLLARDHPRASVINHARSGARTADVLAQIESARGRADALWLNVGGNDVLRLTPLDRLAEDMRAVLAAARRRSPLVVLTLPANFGLAPLFFWPLRPLISMRLRSVRALFASLSEEHGVRLVDFYREAIADPFSRSPGRYYAADGIHPSGEAYAWCYKKLLQQTELSVVLNPDMQAAHIADATRPTNVAVKQAATRPFYAPRMVPPRGVQWRGSDGISTEVCKCIERKH